MNQRNKVTPARIERWARLRACGIRIHTAIQDLYQELEANDPLDQLAVASALPPAVDLQIRMMVGRAVEEGRSWPEISAALGEGHDRTSYRRVRARYRDGGSS